MTSDDDRSKVLHARDFRWEAVPVREYKSEGTTTFRDITRQTLIGEGEDERAPGFVTRYFEIQPGGYSTLEYHAHPHSVVVLRGGGQVILGDRVEPVHPHDVVYIAPHTVHQFHATGDGPLGFLCIVDRERDRPTLPDDDEVERLSRYPDIATRLRR
ncbi:cupin domain-containing protein [Arhodomonas aquaeolei]|uniref:cupin domain-containing protein n=1 Tax=Arhodomonas aquaeolei TaxID=2369 RepID=UPI0003623C69|nr:cupin domain-containing protein [Arhodomonas aquaeolei]